MKFRVSNSVNSFRFKGRRYRSGETIELPESIAVNFSHVLDAVPEVEPVEAEVVYASKPKFKRLRGKRVKEM